MLPPADALEGQEEKPYLRPGASGRAAGAAPGALGAAERQSLWRPLRPAPESPQPGPCARPAGADWPWRSRAGRGRGAARAAAQKAPLAGKVRARSRLAQRRGATLGAGCAHRPATGQPRGQLCLSTPFLWGSFPASAPQRSWPVGWAERGARGQQVTLGDTGSPGFQAGCGSPGRRLGDPDTQDPEEVRETLHRMGPEVVA